MQKLDWNRHCKLFLLSAVVYLLLDLPVQLTGFLTFGSYIGIKNFLPTFLGLQFGPAGILGSCTGAIVAALLLGTPAREILLESLCVLIMGTGTWLLWHLGSSTHRIHFKRGINYLKYFGILVGLSALCGCISLILLEGAFVATTASYTALGLLIGIPVNIMANGLFCLEPILPPMYQIQHAVTGVITADPESLMVLNEALEDFAFTKKLNQRRVFEVESCLEELSIRILGKLPDAQIHIQINYGDTLSAKVCYEGKKYNPLYIEKDEDELDIISLNLIKHRALRAAYQYHNRINHVHVVI